MAGRRGEEEPEQFRKLFIGGLNYDTTDTNLQAFYSKWGEVVDSVVMRDPATKRSRGFGFVTYSTTDMLEDALNTLPHFIDGKEVEPKRATPREESNQSDRGLQIRKIFVGGIGQDTDENHLREYFSTFGPIESTAIVTDKDTGKNRGFGFVVFADSEPVDKCCSVRMHEVNSHRCEVKRSIPRGDDSLSKSAKSTRPGGRGGYGGGGGGGGRSANYGGGGGYGGGNAYGAGGGGYGGGGGGGYGAPAYPDMYGAYGAPSSGWSQPDGAYGAGGYGASNFGSGYGASYGGGAMKNTVYAAKAPGPYGGGYGAGAGGASSGYGGGAGGGYGSAGGSYGGAAAAGGYSGAAYGTGASTAYPGTYPGYGGGSGGY